jgi:hypothetical protein
MTLNKNIYNSDETSLYRALNKNQSFQIQKNRIKRLSAIIDKNMKI